MDKFRSLRKVNVQIPEAGRDNNEDVEETPEANEESGIRINPSQNNTPKGDYLDIPSQPFLMKILEKQGDQQVLFADKVLKFTGSGKMKRRILLITDFAIYIVDLETDALKRRIALAAVEKLCLSELSDNFLAIIIPTEYDILVASTRKSEIVTVLVEATKSTSDYELEVLFSNRFEYRAAAELLKEVQFEEVDGGVKTRILGK
ncbi:myosin IB heavy chain-like [Macadamia integrifolia]|uniref:myosin IB heavy chain-like n=1 Tax=Macadamia integrifolia TaxID=60698 RepID=UPI001C4F0FE2|nr:myosin IB heavy chain-like [Macadamia integrifolia]